MTVYKYEHLREAIKEKLFNEYMSRDTNDGSVDYEKTARAYSEIAIDLTLYNLEVLEPILMKEFEKDNTAKETRWYESGYEAGFDTGYEVGKYSYYDGAP